MPSASAAACSSAAAWKRRAAGHPALTVEKIASGAFERYGIQEWMDGVNGKALRMEDGIRIPSRLLRTLLLRTVRGMLGFELLGVEVGPRGDQRLR